MPPPFSGTFGGRYYDYRSIPQLDNHRHRDWRFPGICPVYFRWYSFVKIFNLFTKKKINPLIGACGLSAVPMASRVANEIALKYDPKNHVLQYCMASNISGVIGSAVAAGVLISFLG